VLSPPSPSVKIFEQRKYMPMAQTKKETKKIEKKEVSKPEPVPILKEENIDEIQKELNEFGKRIKDTLDPVLNEIKINLKDGKVNIANHKVQGAIMTLLFTVPPANALGILDIVRMNISNSIMVTRKPVEPPKPNPEQKKREIGGMFA
jgi:hypothetical protein